ncbi:LamG domain-containing protein [Streptomyces uncialis]|uniref:LamG domain-containing protein n=1 Tax=Streptomyces uncialis TaxID=1048205 RepID=UPI002E36B442|nr:LamG domain-containing protein [Streptomyces uncialis]
MQSDQGTLKIYSDRTYTRTTMVRHQGTALAFAVDDRRRIVYTVLDLSTHDEERGELDAAYWSESPQEVPFPAELVTVGYSVVGATAMPVVKKGGRTEAGADEELAPEEMDRFLSTTARLSADAPFQVISDGTHVVLLRQAIGAADADAVFRLTNGAASGNTARTDFQLAGTARIPVVADTLLCDRFLLVGNVLKPVSEVRFKRSRHKTRPASAKDSLGATDMDGKPFHEPTQQLEFIRNLTQGRFSAVLTPTAVQGQQRWQFFAHNSATGRIDSFNVEQAADGLFNTQGSRYWTSPDARYRGSVYERAPGICPFTNLSLVPITPDIPHPETALQFNGTSNYVDVGAAPALKFQGRAYAVEAWVKPRAAGGPVLARWSGTASQGGFQLRITSAGQVALDHSGGTLTSLQNIPADTWAHIAASFDGTTATLYVNGAFSGDKALPSSGDGNARLQIGAKEGGPLFSGVIDEVRIWNRSRGQSEIADSRHYRLIGNEPGLTAYYRFDEGSGTTAYDQTDTAAHITLNSYSPLWVTSQAPVGEHPGVRRDSFTLAGRDIVSGLTSTLYYQQEDAVSGYQDTPRPAKRNARVLLACATRPSGNTTADAHIATVDFGVGIDGRLADIPDVVTLAELGRPVEQTSDLVSAQQQILTGIEQQATAIQTEITTLTAEKATLEAAIAASNAAAANDPARWIVQFSAFGCLLGPVGGGLTQATLVGLVPRDTQNTRWRLVRAGSASRYGNPTYALVNDSAAGMGVHTYFRSFYSAEFQPLNTAEVHQQWYVRGTWNTSVQFQNAGQDVWMGLISFLQLRDQTSAISFTVEKVGIIPDPTLQVKVNRLAVINPLLVQRNRDLIAKQAEIPPAREELARRTVTLLGEADLVLPVPHIGIDVRGLSSAGALLKFARTAATPSLMDSAAGRVALYFQGANGQFFAAYLDTSAQRGSQQLTGGGLTALFTARDPGVGLSGTQIRVSDCTVNGAAAPSLCDLTITRGGDTETFARLPRRVQDLAAAVNGVTDEPVPLGTAASAAGDQLTLARALSFPVPAHSHLLIGESAHLVTSAADTGGATLRVTPAPATPLAQGTAVSLIRYDTARAVASRPGASLAQGSRWITAAADKSDVLVPNGTATALIPGHGSRWRGDAPGRAFSLNGTTSYLVMGGGAGNAAVTGDLTAEAWINPRRVPAPRSRVFHVRTGDTKAAIALSPEPTTGGLILNGSDVAMAIPGADPTGTDFTVECWLKRTTGRTVADTIVAIGANGLSIGFTSTGAFTFGFTGQTLTTTATYTDGEWHHWAVTFDRTTRAQVILRDGTEVARRTAGGVPSGTAQLIVGRTDSGTYTFFSGRLAELRTWNVARSATDIAADQNRRVAPGEPGLTGAWIYDGSRPQLSQFPDISGQGRHGGVWGSAAASESAVKGYKILAAVGDKHRTSRETYLCGEWAHVAAVHRQSWALRFNGSAWADTPDADALDLTEDLTIEVFAHIDAIGSRQGLVSKGRLGDGAGGTVPYQLSVLADGKLEFAFEEPGPRTVRYTSGSAITAGFHRIAVVRKAGSSSEQVKGTRNITYKDENGATQTKTVDTIDHVDTKSWDDIRFVVDGAETGTGRYTGTGPRGNDGTLDIGRAGEGSALYPLKGTVGEVRIWGKARETNQLGAPLQPRDEGLIARWTFEENTGNTTADLAGGYDLRLHGAKWATDPDPAASSFTVHRNGRSIPCDTPAVNPLANWGDELLTLGAYRASVNQFAEFFDGTLDEVRYWRTARTPEQILDNLFTRVTGDKQDLIGYWTFDTTADERVDSITDQGLRGNHLDLSGNKVPSTAPISTDTAAVRSALAGIRTPFHQNISTPPAATEYADLQFTATGEALGVLKRCYTHTADGAWHLTTGYKVGDLVSEWVSQVQFDPQLIGYIEGAPPVPSENLTGQIDPAGSSSVTFEQADEVTSTLSSTHERSIDASFSMAAGVEVDEKILMITAPLGIGTAQPLASLTLKAHVGGTMEFSNAWTDETSVGQGTSTTHDTTATLTGNWEDPARILNTAVGRRYLPANKGYALVQSETADVYALRLAHSGALVAYRILPNPDIPKDWNIITFPINPQYTKQGTLDGAVGFNDQGKVLDPAYPNAFQRGEYSYFKPREAYAIKRRILRERQELETYYSTVSTETGDTDPTAERAAKVLAPIVGTKNATEKAQPVESAGSFANRNIANTYVWTADGGFFAETTGTVDVVTETTGGSYSLSGSVTGSLEVGFDVAGVGVGLQFDASLGGGMTTTRHRSREATRSHSLNVTCNPSGDLQKYDSTGKAQYTPAGAPVLVPGKVDAYRFMSFYLGQDTSHFNDFYNKVADPIWLETSNDPNAAALREARHSDRTPPCWRVLHRVTFVSRILPPVPATTAPPLEQKMRTIDVASNYELIRRLDPYVSTFTSSQSQLADATRTALTEHLPQLLPYALEISLLLSEYYDVSE